MSVEISSATLVQQPRSRFALILSWVVILGLAGTVVYNNARAGASPAAESMMNVERARMFAMVVVQMMSLQDEAAGASTVVQQRLSTMISQMEEDARTVEDQIRVAILTGESLGVDAALKKLSDISSSSLSSEASEDVHSIETIYSDGAAELTALQSDALIRRHGYLGRLALAHGVPKRSGSPSDSRLWESA
jgi:hypothetical protein